MCGDTHCSSCGDAAAAAQEVAEESLLEYCRRAKLTPEEYHIVLRVGLSAIKQARILASNAEQDGLIDQQEYIYYLEEKVRAFERGDSPASYNTLPL
jgi:hypothetical protein